MDKVLKWLLAYEYLAMFGILFLCGVGLPVPEEVTLIGSGLLVGWGEADFFLASAACVVGILAGDSIIFGLGHHYGEAFLRSRPMRFLIHTKRQAKVASFFAKHGNKAVFFARFVAGVRIGVYAYAGSQKMSWLKFLFLDFLGAIISAPTSIWIGKWAAQKFAADPNEAALRAQEIVSEFGHLLLLGVVVLVVAFIVFKAWRRRRAGAAQAGSVSPGGVSPPAPPPAAPSVEPTVTVETRMPVPAAPPGEGPPPHGR